MENEHLRLGDIEEIAAIISSVVALIIEKYENSITECRKDSSNWIIKAIYYLLIMIKFFRNIPQSLIESAKIDGYNDISILTDTKAAGCNKTFAKPLAEGTLIRMLMSLRKQK